jgi:hypothetical protein
MDYLFRMVASPSVSLHPIWITPARRIIANIPIKVKIIDKFGDILVQESPN